MQMLYTLASVVSAVGNYSVSVGKTLGCGYLGDSLEYLCDDGTVFRGDAVNGGDMSLGYYQNVGRRLGIYISESEDIVILIHLGGGNIACGDSTK